MQGIRFGVLFLLVCAVGKCSGVRTVIPAPMASVPWYCFRANGYVDTLIPCYNASGFDVNCASNFRGAVANGFQRIDLLIDGCYKCALHHDGPLLVDQIMNYIKDNNLTTLGIWFKISGSTLDRWDPNPLNNYFFLYSMTSRLVGYNMQPGIYSTREDWKKIIGDSWESSFNSTFVWYEGIPSPDFLDWPFYDFGNFTAPALKTLSTDTSCSVMATLAWHP